MPHQCTTCGRTFEDGSKEMLSGCPDCGGNKFQFQPAGAVNGSAGGGSGANNANGGVASAATARKKTPESTPPDTANAANSANSANTANATNSTNAAETGATDAPETEGDSRASAVNRAAATVRDWVGKRDGTNDDEPQRGNSSNKGSRRDTPQDARSRSDTSRDDRRGGSSRTDTGRGATESRRTPDGSVPSTSESVPSTEDSAQASARRDVVSESELPEEPPQNTTDSNTGTVDPNATDATADVSGQKSDANVVDTPDDQNPGLKELREELNSQFESIRIVEPGQYELNLMELYEREEYIISLQEDGKYIIEVPDAWDAGGQ